VRLEASSHSHELLGRGAGHGRGLVVGRGGAHLLRLAKQEEEGVGGRGMVDQGPMGVGGMHAYQRCRACPAARQRAQPAASIALLPAACCLPMTELARTAGRPHLDDASLLADGAGGAPEVGAAVPARLLAEVVVRPEAPALGGREAGVAAEGGQEVVQAAVEAAAAVAELLRVVAKQAAGAPAAVAAGAAVIHAALQGGREHGRRGEAARSGCAVVAAGSTAGRGPVSAASR
jgi:hypothetical protein